MARVDRRITLIMSIDDPVGAPTTVSGRLILETNDDAAGVNEQVNKTFDLAGALTGPELASLRTLVGKLITAGRNA